MFPKTFDENEWFVLICLLIFYGIVILLPKRFPLSISILLMLFGVLFARGADHIMAGPSTNAYDIMDTGQLGIFDVLLYFLYAPFSYFFIYLYEVLNVGRYYIPLFIPFFTTISVIFEWICVQFSVFNYNSWEIRNSVTVYLITQILLLLLYFYIKNHYDTKTKKTIDPL